MTASTVSARTGGDAQEGCPRTVVGRVGSRLVCHHHGQLITRLEVEGGKVGRIEAGRAGTLLERGDGDGGVSPVLLHGRRDDAYLPMS